MKFVKIKKWILNKKNRKDYSLFHMTQQNIFSIMDKKQRQKKNPRIFKKQTHT